MLRRLHNANRMPGAPRPPRRAAPWGSAAAAALALALLTPVMGILSGCEKAPAPPVWDNPFDPLGPEDGDPLHLRATSSDGTITLVWKQPQDLGIVEYAISRAEAVDGDWSNVALVAQSTAAENIHLVSNPTPTQVHWFRVQALDGDGNASAVAYATPAAVLLGPRVIINDGATTVASRFVTLKVVVSRGTTLLVAHGPGYANQSTHAAAAPGDTAVIALDAGTAAQGDSVRVRVVATDGDYTSLATVTKRRIDFSPDFGLQGGGTVVGSYTVALAVPPAGVAQMRFAADEAGLAAATWVPGAAAHSQLLWDEASPPQEVWGEFTGDFGISHTAHITVTQDQLDAAAFRLAVPEDRLVTTVDVQGVLTGRATQVRWSESLDLSAVPWVAHADTIDITLSPSAGRKTIYLQMRNDWATSAVLTDYVDLVVTGAAPE